jgi:DNA-binding protein HU-beta
VNKRDLIWKIAQNAQVNNAQACVDSVQASLIKCDRVTLVGFGTFAVPQHKAWLVRVPRREGTIEISARPVTRFTSALDLKVAIQYSMKSGRMPS